MHLPASALAQAAQEFVATTAHDDHVCPGTPQQFVWPFFGAAAISPNLSRALLGTAGPPKDACGRCLELQCTATVGRPAAMRMFEHPQLILCHMPPAQAFEFMPAASLHPLTLQERSRKAADVVVALAQAGCEGKGRVQVQITDTCATCPINQINIACAACQCMFIFDCILPNCLVRVVQEVQKAYVCSAGTLCSSQISQPS